MTWLLRLSASSDQKELSPVLKCHMNITLKLRKIKIYFECLSSDQQQQQQPQQQQQDPQQQQQQDPAGK